MTQNERVKEIRKALGLTLEKFGERIGVTRGSMSNIENGNRNLTEQMTKSICREFSVDYMWLTTGEGEMFIDSDDDFIERIDRIMAGEDDARKNLFKFMLELSDEDIEALDRLMQKAIEFSRNNSNKKD
jgi:transcriptional regulator with XRE-family HTH domain